jgi:hypothetical protein
MTFVYEFNDYYQIIVTDGSESNTLEFNFNKEQDLEISVREANLSFDYASQKEVPKPIII